MLWHISSENRWKKRGIAVIPVKFGIAFTVPFLNQVCSVDYFMSTYIHSG